MPIKVLIIARDHTNPDPDKDRRGCAKKGMISSIKPDSMGWGHDAKNIADFARLNISDEINPTIVKEYKDPWWKRLQYEVLNHNTGLDGYRIKVSATDDSINVSEDNVLTKAEIENFLMAWSATIFEFGTNYVTFDIGIYNILQTDRFWHRNVSSVEFEEVSYDEGTGVHRILADYSAFPISVPSDKIASAVIHKSGDIITHSGRIITFDIARAITLGHVKEDVKMRTEKIYCKRRYQFKSSFVDQIISEGGEKTVTKAEAIAQIDDLLET